MNLQYVTQGVLKRSQTSFNPESSHIRFSLKVEDPVWTPRLGFDKWDPNSRIFEEVSQSKIKPCFLNISRKDGISNSRHILQERKLLEVIGPENIHKCREPPFEAAIYSLIVEGQKHEQFAAISRSELTVEVGESSEQDTNKTEHCSLELPVDFSKKAIIEVNLTLFLKTEIILWTSLPVTLGIRICSRIAAANLTANLITQRHIIVLRGNLLTYFTSSNLQIRVREKYVFKVVQEEK